jgi:hypothetical protein
MEIVKCLNPFSERVAEQGARQTPVSVEKIIVLSFLGAFAKFFCH